MSSRRVAGKGPGRPPHLNSIVLMAASMAVEVKPVLLSSSSLLSTSCSTFSWLAGSTPLRPMLRAAQAEAHAVAEARKAVWKHRGERVRGGGAPEGGGKRECAGSLSRRGP